MAQELYQPKSSTTNELRRTIRIPLVGNIQDRYADASTSRSNIKDQRFVNCYPETTTNTVTNTKKLFLVKRPGYKTLTTSGVTTPTFSGGNGVYSFTNGFPAVTIINNVLYKVTFNAYNSVTYTSIDTLSLGPASNSYGVLDFLDGITPCLLITNGMEGFVYKYNTVSGTITTDRAEGAYLRWTASSIQNLYDIRIPTSTTPTYYYYVSAITGDAKTGGVEPTWPAVVGNTVVDNNVTWTCRALYSYPNSLAVKWQGTQARTLGNRCTPTTENSLWYECTVAGTTNGVEPTWPTTIGTTVVDGTVTWECKGEYGGFPSHHNPSAAFLDGYLFLSRTGTYEIYNSATEGYNSWNPLDYISANQYPDPVIALGKQNNLLVAFGTISTEFFYDAANTNSPLERYQGSVLQVGLNDASAFSTNEKVVFFVGKSDAGKTSVWMMDGTKVQEISTEYVERIMSGNTGAFKVTSIRLDGHYFVLLDCGTVGRTLVYDIEEQIWTEWVDGVTGLQFGLQSFAFTDSSENYILGQNPSTGSLYLISNRNDSSNASASKIYTDAGTNYTVSTTLAKQDFDTYKRKFFHKAYIVGDLSNTNVSISWSDDDYQTYSSSIAVSMNDVNPQLTRLGSSRRRAWKLTHTDNTPLRLEALEVTYTVGEH